MKQIFIPIFVLLLAGCLSAQPRLFVKYDATGANNGTGWEDAYTDLQSAIDDPAGTDIWISAGTYRPGNGSNDTMSAYQITRQVNLIGGFSGTEERPDERDLTNNITILSGDLAGDDVFGNNDMNRLDNSVHVVVIKPEAVFVTLEALTISGGTNQEFDERSDEFYYRGAGVYSNARISASNCDFSANMGGSGASLFLSGSATAGSIFQNCNFFKNTAFEKGALLLHETNDVEIKDCEFYENQCNQGALHLNVCQKTIITNSNFRDNVNNENAGGAIFNWQSLNTDVVSCTFKNNIAGNGAAIYTDHREYMIDQQNTGNFLIQDCTFENNIVNSWGGGAIRAFKSSFEALNSVFIGNKASSTGGAIASNGSQKRILIADCTFENNEAGVQGGAIAVFSDTTISIVKNTVFKNNTSVVSGGAAVSGYGSDATYEDCTFEGNSSKNGGGFYSQNDFTSVTVKNTDFLMNTAAENGGGFYIDGGQNVTVEDSNFDENSALTGGGIGIKEGALDLARLNLKNTIFINNVAATRGGGLNIDNANANVKSCLFAKNEANGDGFGGAISTSGTGVNDLNITVLNSTIVDNLGAFAGGISSRSEDTTVVFIFFQNTALLNKTSGNFAVEEGITATESRGGNFSNDDSGDSFLTLMTDQNDSSADPLFVDVAADDYRILEGSPLVDAGIEDDAPDEDLEGNPRVGLPDIGAFEFQPSTGTGTNTIFEDEQSLMLMPNPVFEETTLTIENDWVGEVQLEISDVSGKQVKSFVLNKNTAKQSFSIEVNELEKGIHFLLLKQNDRAVSKRMIKL